MNIPADLSESQTRFTRKWGLGGEWNQYHGWNVAAISPGSGGQVGNEVCLSEGKGKLFLYSTLAELSYQGLKRRCVNNGV